jgi:CRP-like cAMP-binding protein
MKLSRDTYDRHVRGYKKGSVIFDEGDPGAEMFVIIEGSVEIAKATSGGSAKTLIELAKGDIFGEMAIIEKKRRSARAIATTDTRLLVLDEVLFERTLHENPDFARKMIRLLSERLRRANSILQSVLATNRQNQVLEALFHYAGEFGMLTFKGARVNIDEFAEWASGHIGIDSTEIRQAVEAFKRRRLVQESALGEDEIIVNRRN